MIQGEIRYGSREEFDAMETSELMGQVKRHIALRKDQAEYWKANPLFAKALDRCCRILSTRGITIAIAPISEAVETNTQPSAI